MFGMRENIIFRFVNCSTIYQYQHLNISTHIFAKNHWDLNKKARVSMYIHIYIYTYAGDKSICCYFMDIYIYIKIHVGETVDTVNISKQKY